jgi:phage terminase small subunit
VTRATLLAPPASLPPGARAAWRSLAPKLLAAGLYLPIDRLALEHLCWGWATAEQARRQLRNAPEDSRAAWKQALETARGIARRQAAAFLLIPEARIPCARVDAEGRDIELARIFDPTKPLRPVRLTAAARRRLGAWTDRARAVGLLPPAPRGA